MPSPPRKTGSKVGRKRKRTDRLQPARPIGRPKLYLGKAHDELAYVTALGGDSVEKLAERIGVDRDTIYDWLKKFPDFSDKWNLGKTDMKDSASISLLKRVKGFIATDVEERESADGSVVKRTIKREIIPDTSAISLAFDRCEDKGGLDAAHAKVDEILNAIKNMKAE